MCQRRDLLLLCAGPPLSVWCAFPHVDACAALLYHYISLLSGGSGGGEEPPLLRRLSLSAFRCKETYRIRESVFFFFFFYCSQEAGRPFLRFVAFSRSSSFFTASFFLSFLPPLSGCDCSFLQGRTFEIDGSPRLSLLYCFRFTLRWAPIMRSLRVLFRCPSTSSKLAAIWGPVHPPLVYNRRRGMTRSVSGKRGWAVPHRAAKEHNGVVC